MVMISFSVEIFNFGVAFFNKVCYNGDMGISNSNITTKPDENETKTTEGYMDRRTFVKGLGIAAAAAAIFGLTGCGPNGNKDIPPKKITNPVETIMVNEGESWKRSFEGLMRGEIVDLRNFVPNPSREIFTIKQPFELNQITSFTLWLDGWDELDHTNGKLEIDSLYPWEQGAPATGVSSCWDEKGWDFKRREIEYRIEDARTRDLGLRMGPIGEMITKSGIGAYNCSYSIDKNGKIEPVIQGFVPSPDGKYMLGVHCGPIFGNHEEGWEQMWLNFKIGINSIHLLEKPHQP